ncbi:MAG: hypothetical protein NC251_08330 [Lachnoclostridium sp.]|nr:hypothetical protein [Lachnospira sp.]MCM1248421.1 hypothetical protein [Lachnoclostridium sp.]
MKSSSKEGAFSEILNYVSQELYMDGRSVGIRDVADGLKEHISDEKILKPAEEPEETEGFLMAEAGRFAYDSLSEAEQIWYRDMESILGSMEKEVKLSKEGLDAGLDETCIDTIFQCVMIDHPELFYVNGYSYNQYLKGLRTTAIMFSGNYAMEKEEAQKRRSEIEEAADALLAEAPSWGDDYGKVKYVYETLIENTEYDLTAEDNQNIYSVFVNHKSVCQGYAKATQYLLLKMGIECVLVQGSVDTGEAHSWNLVKADGDYYYVDTTWGDASYQKQEEEGIKYLENTVNYDYLCVDTEQLLRTHILGGLVPMPMCIARTDNYYVQEGALFSEYDEERMADLFAVARERQKENVTIKCDNINCFQEMKRLLIDERKILDFMDEDGKEKEVSYACNEKQLSFMFWTD